jgi:hypothetical protein
MAKPGPVSRFVCAAAVGVALLLTRTAAAADFHVASPSALQAALNSAQGGDTVYLAPGDYSGNFKLPVHAGTGYVTVRTEDPAGVLPGPDIRITPSASPNLARLMSPNSTAVLRTAPGASYWRLELLEVGPAAVASMTLIELGDGSSAQNSSSLVPHHLIADRLYVHGDPLNGVKRGVGLNSGETVLLNSYIADVKGIGFDSQAVAGWNGPGPYRIENNYMEAAGTAVLFGGDDPKILNQVPTDIVFRDNTVTRPVSWREPILPAPTGTRGWFSAGGSLAAGTYGYRVVARRMIGSTQVKSAASVEASATVAAGSRVTIAWNAVPDATDYLVYGRTPGAPNRYWVVKATSFTDDGVIASLSGTPGSATMWQIKNLFELKNARAVRVSHNLFANNWAQAQSGTAILFTTRNQGGNCPWCVVEDVTFEHNVVSGVGGGFQITGTDNLQPSLQGNTFRIRHNLIADLSKSWGGKAYLVTITDGPRDVTFDHNTIVSPDGSGLVMAGGVPVYGFVFTNNVARHNTYGIFGSGQSVGLKTLAYYFPDSVVTRNVFAGGPAAVYPSGNEFPSTASFESHFVDYSGGDYALRPGTDWQGSGTDALDLGADMLTLAGAGSADASMPTESRASVPALTFTTTSLPDTTEGSPYAASLSAAGGVAPYTWSTSGLPGGIYLDAATPALAGAAVLAGDYTITVQVTDVAGTSVSGLLSMHVNRAIPPVSIVTGGLNTVTATVPSAQALEAAGGLGSYTWTVSGALPAGITLDPTGVLAGTTSATGTYSLTVTVSDAQDAQRSASQAFSLYVAPPPNHPPTVTLTVPAANDVAQVGSTLTVTALAADVDGNLSRVDLYAGATFLGTSTGPQLTLPWLVPTAGPFQLTAVATDTRGEIAWAQVTITTNSEVVLYASDVRKIAGNYQLAADATAAGGTALWNPDKAAAKVTTAAASPASYAEFTFYAEAGRPYHLWIRGRGQKNSWANDSAYVQFSGVPAARIGTTASYWYSVEEAVNAGISGWGWEDNGYGTGVMGDEIVFETTGMQTIRIQPREDGLSIDQIVLSPQKFLTASPGTLKNDATILGK